MDEKDAMTVERQRKRRNRVNRIKTGIILLIAIWMIVSLVAIIVLAVQVVLLNRRLATLEAADSVSAEANTAGQDILPDTEAVGTEAETEEDGGVSVTLSYSDVETGIDSPENMAEEGDVHEVYLTFNGSPTENTDAILDELAEYGVKATFFVNGDDSEEAAPIYQRIVDEGHTLGMNSYCNQYSTIYESVDAFCEDYEKLSDLLVDVTGVKSLYYRFPGGSSNEISNVDMVEFVRVLNENGIVYFDWNVSAGDASSDCTADDIVENVTSGVSKYKTSVVLLHDGDDKTATVEAIGPLIEALTEMDAQILPIDEDTTVIQYIKAESVD